MCPLPIAGQVGSSYTKVAEEPERSDGNRLYGGIADKKAVGSKGITAFYDNKKTGIFYDPGGCFYLVAGAGGGEAEEPERSDGNRLYGSIADKKTVGSKGITAFYDNKKKPESFTTPAVVFNW